MSKVKKGKDHWKSKIKERNTALFDDLMINNPDLNQYEIAKRLGWNVSTVRKHYREWKEKRIVEWVAKADITFLVKAGDIAFNLCSKHTGISKSFCEKYINENYLKE